VAVIDITSFNKHINILLAQVSAVISKNELFSDIFAISLKALSSLVEVIHANYDSKVHASSLQALKQILQTVFRKLDNAMKSLDQSKLIDED
jgi:hypothetical protein